MSLVVIYLAFLIILFVAAYFTKRRFGVLGLALAAGSILSGFWTSFVVDRAQTSGVEIASPLLVSLVASILVLLPALLLLSSGPTYSSQIRRIAGAFLFACLAVAFLIEPLQSVLILQGDALSVYNFFANNRIYIITVGLVVALVDVLLTHTSKEFKYKSKH